MPIYEYRCENCNYILERIQKFSDPDPVTCPKCNTNNLKKLISNSSFSLKGTGWHITDYKDKPPCPSKEKCEAKNSGTTCCQKQGA